MQTTVPAHVKAICDRFDMSLEDLLSYLECDLESLVDSDEDEIEHLLEAHGMDLYPSADDWQHGCDSVSHFCDAYDPYDR